METLLYLNFALTLGLGGLLAVVTSRIYATKGGRATQPAGPSLEDTTQMRIELRDEVLESVSKKALQTLVRSELKQRIEEVVVDRLARGAFAAEVKQTLDERMHVLQKYIETEVVPRAVAARLEATAGAHAA